MTAFVQSELSFLAQEAVALDKLAPETWVVVGNCFSLQKEHDTALQFLKRVRGSPLFVPLPSPAPGLETPFPFPPSLPPRCSNLASCARASPILTMTVPFPAPPSP